MTSVAQNGSQDILQRQKAALNALEMKNNLEHEQLLSLPNIPTDVTTDLFSHIQPLPSDHLHSDEKSPEQLGELLVDALEHDERETALHLIEDCTIPLSIVENDEESNCLMIAARKNNLKFVEKLLKTRRSEININATDLFGWTALMYACYYGHSEIIRVILLAGAQVDIYDNDHMSCLIWAAGRGHLDCVTKLLQIGRAKVNQVDKFGSSSLIWACRRGFSEIASTLLKAGANIDTIGMFGWSAVLAAVHENHVETLKILLQHKPNINTCDNHRYTPLMMASKEGKLEIVHLLLKARALVNLTDKHGYTALNYATKGAHLEVVDLLLKHNAEVNHVPDDKRIGKR